MTNKCLPFNKDFAWHTPSDKQLAKLQDWVETLRIACGVEEQTWDPQEWQVYYKPRLKSDQRQGDWMYGFNKEFMADRLSRLEEAYAKAKGWGTPRPKVLSVKPEPEPRTKEPESKRRRKQKLFNHLVTREEQSTDEEAEAVVSLQQHRARDGERKRKHSDGGHSRHRKHQAYEESEQEEVALMDQQWPSGLEWLGQIGMVSQLGSVATCVDTYFNPAASLSDRQTAYKALMRWFNPEFIATVNVPSEQLRIDMVDLSVGVRSMLEEEEANGGVPENWAGYYSILCQWWEEASAICEHLHSLAAEEDLAVAAGAAAEQQPQPHVDDIPA